MTTTATTEARIRAALAAAQLEPTLENWERVDALMLRAGLDPYAELLSAAQEQHAQHTATVAELTASRQATYQATYEQLHSGELVCARCEGATYCKVPRSSQRWGDGDDWRRNEPYPCPVCNGCDREIHPRLNHLWFAARQAECHEAQAFARDLRAEGVAEDRISAELDALQPLQYAYLQNWTYDGRSPGCYLPPLTPAELEQRGEPTMLAPLAQLSKQAEAEAERVWGLRIQEAQRLLKGAERHLHTVGEAAELDMGSIVLYGVDGEGKKRRSRSKYTDKSPTCAGEPVPKPARGRVVWIGERQEHRSRYNTWSLGESLKVKLEELDENNEPTGREFYTYTRNLAPKILNPLEQLRAEQRGEVEEEQARERIRKAFGSSDPHRGAVVTLTDSPEPLTVFWVGRCNHTGAWRVGLRPSSAPKKPKAWSWDRYSQEYPPTWALASDCHPAA